MYEYSAKLFSYASIIVHFSSTYCAENYAYNNNLEPRYMYQFYLGVTWLWPSKQLTDHPSTTDG